MTEHWLKQPKMLPISTNHHKTSANKSSLNGVALSLVQIKHTYPCLQAFTMTELWPKQPKMLPSTIHHKTSANKPSLTAVALSDASSQIGSLHPSMSSKRSFPKKLKDHSNDDVFLLLAQCIDIFQAHITPHGESLVSCLRQYHQYVLLFVFCSRANSCSLYFFLLHYYRVNSKRSKLHASTMQGWHSMNHQM